MILPVVIWQRASAEERRAALQRPVTEDSTDRPSRVRQIVAAVKQRGDQALLEWTAALDGAKLSQLRVSQAEIASARSQVDDRFVDDLSEAIAWVRRFHQPQRPASMVVQTSMGVRCERRWVPIERVGLYVPGGTAPLFSTVVMLGVPSQIAGCPVRILATPPRPDGSIDPQILVAASLVGIADVFKLGGAQAIAALAYGSASVPKVDKIFGPGNAWVAEAKLQVAQDAAGAALDLPAGPSEVLVIADASADPEFVAADLLAQAEHGIDSQVILVSDAPEQIEQVNRAVAEQLERLPRREIAAQALGRSTAILVDDLAAAMAISNQYAPEHLILAVRQPRRLVESVRCAGSVFLGRWTPETVGDYGSGTNHVLPTSGWARAYPGLSTESFMTSFSLQELDEEGIASLGPVVARLADREGLAAHAEAVRLRLRAQERGK